MQQVREILRQKLALGRSHRRLRVSASAEHGLDRRCRRAALGLDAATIEKLTDAESRPGSTRSRCMRACVRSRTARRSISSCVVRRDARVASRRVLGVHPDGLRYTSSAIGMRLVEEAIAVMRQVHVAGDKLSSTTLA